MRYGSVCSGIEAATVAWHPLGWDPAFFSEIDAFPRAVLQYHYPDVPLHGDFTTIGGDEYGPIDLLVGGTPCQSFSIAGLRKGLDDDRGNLALEFLKLAHRARPRWVAWENVPGVLSSNGGRDFGAFLGGLGELGYGWAYRVLDAQYVRVDSHPRAVPQRRRRVFVVGCAGDWRRAAAVLFEPEGMSGHPAPRREAGKGAAGGVAQGVALRGRDEGGTAELTGDVAVALRASQGGGDKPYAMIPDVAHTLRGRGFDASEDGTGRGIPLIASTGDVSHCLNAGGMGRIDYETETLVAFSSKDYGADASSEVAPTMRAMGHDRSHANAGGQLAVAFNHQTGGDFRPMISEGVANALQRNQGQAVATAWAVRRLLPVECERLQGFPDDYTLVPYRGKPASDDPRYKALGNSMAVNVMSWIGQRIQMVEGL